MKGEREREKRIVWMEREISESMMMWERNRKESK